MIQRLFRAAVNYHFVIFFGKTIYFSLCMCFFMILMCQNTVLSNWNLTQSVIQPSDWALFHESFSIVAVRT